jgi:NAD(P)-dependent dehydrogenase (short-subunit alcohol dehydrogenase family)
MSGGLAGKVALVSGAGSGIGRAAATRLASAGAAIALVGRTAARLAETRDAIADAGVEAYPADIGNPTEVEAVVAAVLARFSRIDIVVNAAGINVPRRSLADGSVEDFEKVLETNLRGAFLLSRAVVPPMRTQGGGTIIHVASDSAMRGNDFAGIAYTASKFGVRGLVEAMNAEERRHGIRVTAIFPGEVNTPLLDKRPIPVPAEARQRMLQPEDVAECIALAAMLPPRAVVEQLIVRPVVQEWVSRRS